MAGKYGFVLGLLAASLMAGGTVARGTRPQAAPASSAPKKAEEQFKNIQVLKGVPADQVIPGMQFIGASLGVECDFCHVQGALEKDEKKTKQTARKMMQMMFAINKDNFDDHREVTCYSCHRGSPMPIAIPAVVTEESKEPMTDSRKLDATESKPASGPSAEQLFDKYVQALGGSTAVDKVTSRIQRGTINFGGQQFPIDIYTKDPDKRISFTHMSGGDNVTAFNGHEGWLSAPGHPLREMHGSDLDGAAIDADLHFATHLKQMFSDAQVRGSEKVDDHDVYLVEAQRQGKPPIQLYFDKQSGLLVRLVRYGDTPFGEMPTQVDYADYRDAHGVKIPWRWTLARPSGRFTIQVNEMEQNSTVDDAKFAKPRDQAGEPNSQAH